MDGLSEVFADDVENVAFVGLVQSEKRSCRNWRAAAKVTAILVSGAVGLIGAEHQSVPPDLKPEFSISHISSAMVSEDYIPEFHACRSHDLHTLKSGRSGVHVSSVVSDLLIYF